MHEILKQESLYQLYVVDVLPLEEIAKMANCDRANVSYHAKKYGFPKRNKSPILRHVGEEVGDWTLLSCYLKRNHTIWQCRCKCGVIKDIEISSLNRRRSRSCWECGTKRNIDNRTVPSDYWRKIKWHAKKRKLKFKISQEYLEQLFINQNYKCNISGIPLIFARGRGEVNNRVTTASLDRIDSNKDYIIGNVQWIHKDINRMKNNYDQNYFIELCSSIHNYRGASNVESARISEVRKNS